jgi:methylated-DNA-[protein]-cysteine S-methyltransferase
VGWGQTTTFGDVARLVGAGPQSARGVGQAMAHNPVPVIIPCHRVLAAGGKLGGFSAPGGVDTKLHMLELEGVQLASRTAPESDQGSFNF